jgi:hypothetical protein
VQLEECAKVISSIINKLEPLHVLDYGCGESVPLGNALKKAGISCSFKYQLFDANVERFSSTPLPADVVLCVNLLGSLSEEDSEAALEELHRLTDCVGFYVITGSPLPAEWWLPRLIVRFDLQTFQVVEQDSFYVVVYSQKGVIENVEGEKLA